MNRRELDLLESAFAAEIGAAINPHTPRVIQTRSKLAAKLVDDGLLVREIESLGGRPPVWIEGYVLTHAGRLAYCASVP